MADRKAPSARELSTAPHFQKWTSRKSEVVGRLNQPCEENVALDDACDQGAWIHVRLVREVTALSRDWRPVGVLAQIKANHNVNLHEDYCHKPIQDFHLSLAKQCQLLRNAHIRETKKKPFGRLSTIQSPVYLETEID
ncbi:unnamed protein product [Sphagnum balticum]